MKYYTCNGCVKETPCLLREKEVDLIQVYHSDGWYEGVCTGRETRVAISEEDAILEMI